MRLSRGITNRIRFLLDECIPSVLRDSPVIMKPLFKFILKEKATLVLDFKQKVHRMDDAAFDALYQAIGGGCSIERETDLTNACIEKIQHSIKGTTIVDIGCGTGYLAGKLSNKYTVTACDIVVTKESMKHYPQVRFVKGRIERLPFQDNEFDTVLCTHTLEHVKDLQQALRELRRITKKRLIIVVPKQRPYQYTFDLHIQFFPYKFMLEQVIGYQKHSIYEEIDGDFYYQEEKN